jgi:Spy/CpxP family protein refolding chaperone
MKSVLSHVRANSYFKGISAMKKTLLTVAVLLIAASRFSASAQDATKGAAKPEEKPTSAVVATPGEKTGVDRKGDEKKTTNRLPPRYGKLGLSDSQKSRVYAIQDKHDKEIDSLTEKLKAAKAKRDSEIETVLTPAQKKSLTELGSGKGETKESSQDQK